MHCILVAKCIVYSVCSLKYEIGRWIRKTNETPSSSLGVTRCINNKHNNLIETVQRVFWVLWRRETKYLSHIDYWPKNQSNLWPYGPDSSTRDDFRYMNFFSILPFQNCSRFRWRWIANIQIRFIGHINHKWCEQWIKIEHTSNSKRTEFKVHSNWKSWRWWNWRWSSNEKNCKYTNGYQSTDRFGTNTNVYRSSGTTTSKITGNTHE